MGDGNGFNLIKLKRTASSQTAENYLRLCELRSRLPPNPSGGSVTPGEVHRFIKFERNNGIEPFGHIARSSFPLRQIGEVGRGAIKLFPVQIDSPNAIYSLTTCIGCNA
jgi:hypothetical protein